ncbi:MAG: TolC family protein [Planctomycetes bacterium]|nr:TolC family protein [Planctomycetota bacterium]MCC7172723.1 TolC family protein [Planctomycetota bacterium]
MDSQSSELRRKGGVRFDQSDQRGDGSARQTFVLTALVMFVGCVNYTADPLIPTEELAALRQRTLDDVRIEHGVDSPHDGSFDPSDGLDEPELVAIALALNPELRAKRAAIGEAQSLLITAGTWPNPTLGASVRSGIGDTSGLAVGMDVLFELLRPAERNARTAVATVRLEATQAEVLAEEYRVVARTRRAHVDLLGAEQIVHAFEQEASLREQAAAMIRERKGIGEATALDVVAVELEKTNIARELREARYDVEVREGLLRSILGVPPTMDLVLTARGRPLSAVVQPDLDDDAVDAGILAHRLDLKASEAAYRVAEEELRLATTKQAPRFSLGPSFEREVEGAQSLGVGGSVELPLFDRNQGEIAARLAARDRARADYVALLHAVRASAFAARSALTRTKAELEAQQRDVLPLVDQTDALFMKAFQSREVTAFEWLSARSRALDARRGFMNALVSYAGAVADLEAATGAPLDIVTPHAMPKEQR